MGTFFENFSFHPEMFISNLKYMGLGMLCILIVMGIIILLKMLLEKVSVKKKDKEE